jgi:hypothetical protein
MAKGTFVNATKKKLNCSSQSQVEVKVVQIILRSDLNLNFEDMEKNI